MRQEVLVWLKRRWFVFATILPLAGTVSYTAVSDHLIIREVAAQQETQQKRIDRAEKIQLALFFNITLLCQAQSVSCVSIDQLERGDFTLPMLKKEGL
jgi:hypothetical protein